ncbi:hypothetical protein [Microbacterium sp. NFH-22A-Y]|uniref:hypothetical protein n=1 Tax=Microbacterium sp. NFH-22A-Y TaxID=2744448 RepID=UPI001F373688|nr:hypothetical protein [Microbacterium sp. NFH-22A-Y]
MNGQATSVDLELASSYVDPYPGRKGRERIVETCGGCGGTGVYNAPSSVTFYTSAVNDITTGCFSCAGTGVRSFLVSSARQTARRRAKETDRARATAARIAHAREAFMASHGAVYEALTEQHTQLRHTDPIRNRIGLLLDSADASHAGTVDVDEWRVAAEVILEEIAIREDAKRPVPTGRIEIEAEVLSTKWVENDYRGSLKMLLAGEGWKVWGTVPRSLDFNDRSPRGHRIALTATIEASADDEAFGFFSRPTKARILTAPPVPEED